MRRASRQNPPDEVSGRGRRKPKNVSRRGVLAGAAAAAAVGSQVSAADATVTARSRRPLTGKRNLSSDASPVSSPAVSARMTTTSALSEHDQTVLSRFTFGVTQDVLDQVDAAGGVQGWFTEQLSPAAVSDASANAVVGWFPLLSKTAPQIWAGFNAGSYSANVFTEDMARWTLLRRILSRKAVLEVMTDFWSNLLHVPNPMDKCWPVRFKYDAVIRLNALGRYDQLLEATLLHPAMLLYLDAYVSTASDLNENLGREVLECHTVGIDGGYSEAEVTASARILTGWTVDRGGTWIRSYKQENHALGPVKVMGFSETNSLADGRTMSQRYLRYLAHHPATANRLARRLCVRFVSDYPPQALVDAVAAAYLASDTDISATLRAMINHESFGTATGKVRTPIEDYVATCRALRIRIKPPTMDADFARLGLWQCQEMGQMPFDWPRPDGFPDADAAWASTSRMLGSWKTHHALATSFRPATGVTYQTIASWMPTLPMPFETLVDTVCQRLLMQPVAPGTLQAACLAVDVRIGEVITPTHRFVKYNWMPLLLACLLDSAQNMTR